MFVFFVRKCRYHINSLFLSGKTMGNISNEGAVLYQWGSRPDCLNTIQFCVSMEKNVFLLFLKTNLYGAQAKNISRYKMSHKYYVSRGVTHPIFLGSYLWSFFPRSYVFNKPILEEMLSFARECIVEHKTLDRRKEMRLEYAMSFWQEGRYPQGFFSMSSSHASRVLQGNCSSKRVSISPCMSVWLPLII